MNNPVFFIGKPLDFKGKFKIYPPTVSDVVTNPRYSQFLKMLTISQEDIQEELNKKLKEGQAAPTPFEFLFNNSYYSMEFRVIANEAFKFFIHEPINFLYEEKMLVIGDLEKVVTEIHDIKELVTLSEEEYFEFQNTIREACGIKPLAPPEPPNPDEDPRITEIKARARMRDRIKAKQQNNNGISIQTCLVAICCMGLGITPLNIGEMSYAAIGPIMSMIQDKEKYDIDIRSLLAGADSKKVKPKYWIRNSDKE